MSIGIDAQLEQLARLKKNISSLTSSSEQARGRYNYQQLNTKVESNIKRADAYLQNNPDKISQGELNVLNQRLAEQRVTQEQSKLTPEMGDNGGGGPTGLNWSLNKTAQGRGVSDEVLNDSLQSEPEFVKTAGEALRSELVKELHQKQKGQVKLGSDESQLLSQDDKQDLGFKSNQQRRLESKQLLQGLQQEQASNVARQQVRRQKQLSELRASQANRASFDSPVSQLKKSRLRSKKKYRPKSAPLVVVAGKAVGAKGATARPMEAGNATEESRISMGLPVSPLETRSVAATVAGGTYSLPVELPDGQVQLDFARPGGAAELSITATPENIDKNLWSSAIVIAIATLVSIIALLVSKRIRKVRNICVSVK